MSHRHTRAPCLGLALVLLALGCVRQPGDTTSLPAADPEQVLAAEPIPFYRPATIDQVRTTGPRTYLGNLDSRIDALRKHFRARPSPQTRVALAGALLHRHEVLGTPDDLARAEGLLHGQAAGAAALIMRARVHTRRHRFEAARADLTKALELGAESALVEPVRALIRTATEPAPPPVEANAGYPTLTGLAMEGIRLVEAGRPADATRKFAQAQRVYRDTDPLALAWLHVQQGVLYLRYHRLEPARVFFEAAYRRLPRYYLAAEHLAETEAALGNLARAAALYRQVTRQTGDPVFHAALAEVERRLGNDEAAAAARQEARRRFAIALRQHPEAVWFEAAEFERSAGRLDLAYDYARRNVGLRENPASRIQLADIAADTGRIAEACRVLNEAESTGLNPPELQLLRARLAAHCTAPD